MADVVVPVYADVALTHACIESVLEHSGPALGRLILVDDCGPDAEMRPMLRSFRDQDVRVHVLENPRNLGFVGTANRGLSICEGHAVILNSDTQVTAGWLEALLTVLSRSERIAAVCPLSNNGTLCSVPTFGESAPEEEVAGIPGALEELPEWTELPTGNGFCMLMRDTALGALGLFDPAYGRGYNEENDWCQRVRAQGMVIARANRSFVLHRGEVSFGASRPVLDLMNATRLVARYPRYLDENRAFADSPPAHLAASGARGALEQERWSLHPAVDSLPGIAPWLHSLSSKRKATLTPWSSGARPGASDVSFAPLNHESVESASAALRGTGRLVTLMDAWRPPPVGPLRALRWAQLLASDAVLVPCERAAAWLAEEGAEENVHVVDWPAQVTGKTASERPGPGKELLLASSSPAIVAMVELALARLDSPPLLKVIPSAASLEVLEPCLENALAVADFGGTSAGLLARAIKSGVPVLSGLLSVAGAPFLPSIPIKPTPDGVLEALAKLSGAHPTQPVAATTDVRVWLEVVERALKRPLAQRAEARAALQVLVCS